MEVRSRRETRSSDFQPSDLFIIGLHDYSTAVSKRKKMGRLIEPLILEQSVTRNVSVKQAHTLSLVPFDFEDNSN